MNLYTYGGKFFGNRDGDNLWTHDGRHVGRFRGDDVYDKQGRYLGEIKSGKLITNRSKAGRSSSSFTPHAGRVGFVPSVGHVGSVLPVGYEDFPGPDDVDD
jgi:hypothetical protein